MKVIAFVLKKNIFTKKIVIIKILDVDAMGNVQKKQSMKENIYAKMSLISINVKKNVIYTLKVEMVVRYYVIKFLIIMEFIYVIQI